MTSSQLADFAPLSEAEQRLLAGLQSATFERLGDGQRPEAATTERRVRADLLRFLLLGQGDAPRLHEKGLRVAGAWITGPLDLEGCRIGCDIGLVDCHFEARLNLRGARIDAIFLDGAVLPGLTADRLEARGGVYLRGSRVEGSVVLPGARLGGELVLDGAAVEVLEGVAVDADRLEVAGGVLLRGATIKGTVRIAGARIGADLDATGAVMERPKAPVLWAEGLTTRGDVLLRLGRINGQVSLVGARIGGDVDLGGGRFEFVGDVALKLERAVVEGAFFLRQGAKIEGALALTDSQLGAIVDDPTSWPGPGELLLNRCRYGAFIDAPTDARRRLDWLARQDPARWGQDFWPQPYEQLASVLGELGHDEDVTRVLIEKERLQRRARRVRARNGPTRGLLWLKDAVIGGTVRYGRQPLVAFVWLIGIWLLGSAVLMVAYAEAAMRPNVPVVLRAPEWVLCEVPRTAERALPSLGQARRGLARPGESQLACYLRQPEAAAYPAFNPWMLSLEALLPALELKQEAHWAADTRHAAGHAARAYLYAHTIAGWALSLLAVAGFSGIVKSR
ncbi:MAG: hypothetical protein EA356_00645 [Geminicoccaceae bacterium]|nr:MAG: hypothetical protein EA356_00645 [Geminicoccaceae bacterium]